MIRRLLERRRARRHLSYSHLTELRFRALNRCLCRDPTPEERKLLQALDEARNAERA